MGYKGNWLLTVRWSLVPDRGTLYCEAFKRAGKLLICKAWTGNWQRERLVHVRLCQQQGEEGSRGPGPAVPAEKCCKAAGMGAADSVFPDTVVLQCSPVGNGGFL